MCTAPDTPTRDSKWSECILVERMFKLGAVEDCSWYYGFRNSSADCWVSYMRKYYWYVLEVNGLPHARQSLMMIIRVRL